MTQTGLYLDVCALSRPFDDQNYLRIRMETEAVNLILSAVRRGLYRLLVSPVHIREVQAIEEYIERVELELLLAEMGKPVSVDEARTRARAEKLIKLGFGIADAAHVAFAEQSGAHFISSDDRLIKKCSKNHVGIWCGNPVAFCEREGLR